LTVEFLLWDSREPVVHPEALGLAGAPSGLPLDVTAEVSSEAGLWIPRLVGRGQGVAGVLGTGDGLFEVRVFEADEKLRFGLGAKLYSILQ
jgi:hypothetical protein